MSITCDAETVIYHRGEGYQRICGYDYGHDGKHDWEDDQ